MGIQRLRQLTRSGAGAILRIILNWESASFTLMSSFDPGHTPDVPKDNDLAALLEGFEGDLMALRAQRDDALELLNNSESERSQLRVDLELVQQQKQEASEEAELTLLQLHQVQEELEKYFLKAQEAEGQLNTLKDQLRSQAEELEQAQQVRNQVLQQKQEASQEAELVLLQLHQVQEELEHYFLQARGADQLAAAQQDQLLRAQALMARFLPEEAALAPAQRVSVEVLPPATQAVSVQTEALLRSYATSLSRASALLQRAIQR